MKSANAREQSGHSTASIESYSELDGCRGKTRPSTQTPKEKDPWIYSKFKKKTCSHFIPSEKEANSCCCGRLKNDHQKEALTIRATSDVKWEVSKHTKLNGPTNAYGELEFTGAGQASRAKFIRISNDAEAEDVLRLFKEKWNLELPKLVISVTGGAKNFVMHHKLKHLFRQGLLKVAQTTGAWIMTGGTNTGVMRHVGKAVKGHTVMSRGALLKDKTSHVNLIGIATWGIVEHRSNLINSKDVVTYHITSKLKSKGSCIDNNHSHFVLVDDGTEGQYGGEIDFRARLQNCITKKQIPRKYGDSPDDKSHGIPVVLVVLEGGPNTIETVLKSVTSCPAVPVVIAEGSGRAADILAYAYSIFTSNNGTVMKHMSEVAEHEILRMRIEKAFQFKDKDSQECIAIYHKVRECMENCKYITIFHMDEDGVDIDRAILRALLKAQSACPTDQLDLALTWNRADIARTEIFTKDRKWEMKTLEGAMMDALINNRVDFVNLLLENGVSMRKFLTHSRLEELYTNAVKPIRVVFEELIGKDKIDDFKLSDVEDALEQLLGGTYKEHEKVYSTIMKALKLGNEKMFTDGVRKEMADSVPKPYKELLLWAVLCNKKDMALFMWERGDENLARALLAAKLYNLMARLTKSDDSKADFTDELMRHFDEFKQLSLNFLGKCFRTNEELTQQLLTYNLAEKWGGQTCLSLAFATEHEEFMAHVSCQTLLAEIWTGKMKTSQKSSVKTVLGLLFPPAILLLEFHPEQPSPDPSKKQQELGHDNHGLSSKPDDENEDNSGIELSGIPASSYISPNETGNTGTHGVHGTQGTQEHREQRTQGTQEIPLSWKKKFVEFYKAPATKFWANVFDFMAFLVLFSYVILVHQDKIPSIYEIVLIIFVCTLCTEEIRQILHSKPPMLRNKFKEWASNKWNLLDGVAVVLFFVGLGLRLHPTTRGAGHVVYCFDVALWIMRLLDFFSVSEHMGPYVVMIGRMTVDLTYFLLIMVVFFLAYGVAQQAILFPQELPSWSMASRVFFRPYFQAHGELFMDAPDTIENTTTVFGTPRKDGYGDTVVSFMTALYLLVVNILLLNLLIAIFNNTYESVHAHANQIWKFQRYTLVMEYEQRPVLIPPFIIVNHVIYAIRYMCRLCLRKCRGEGNGEGDGTDKPRKDYDDKLKMFEELCVDVYIREKDTLLHASQEEKIRVIGDRMESVSCQLQDMYKESIGKSKSVDNRLKKLEEDLTKLLEDQHRPRSRLASLADIELTGLSSRLHNPGVAVNSLTSVPKTEQSSSTSHPRLDVRLSPVATREMKTASKNESREKLTSHVQARQSPYPMSSQQRYFVPDFLVAWQETFPAYDPPLYTAQKVQASPPWADPDIMDPANTSLVINFNYVEDGINRRSHTGEIDVVNRLPRNPVGRTGIAGRGLFGRWGPNHAAHLIATRWKISENGKIVQKKGKKVLEFLAVKSPNSAPWAMGWRVGEDGKNVLKLTQKNSSDSLRWAIPGGMMEIGDSVPATLKKSFLKKVFPSLKLTIAINKKTMDEGLHTIVQNAEEVYKGYVDDLRNTDNAWMETVTMSYHDETREILGDFEFEDKKDAYGVNWHEVSGHINLQANHSFILHKVAKLRNAYF